METIIILDTALISTAGDTTEKDKCINQYIAGFFKIAGVVQKYPDIFDLYWVDSTIEPDKQYDSRLISKIENLPNLKGKKMFFDNYYGPNGQVNKGCGLIAAWREILPEIINKRYKFIIHFEPRQEIKDSTFFETFIKNPGSYFKTMRKHPDARFWRKYFPPYRTKEVWTGLFSCPPSILLDYIKGKDLTKLAEKKFNIEDDLYNYLKENRIPFKSLLYLGLCWHDNIHDLHVIV